MLFAEAAVRSMMVLVFCGACLAMLFAWLALASDIEKRQRLGKPLIPPLPAPPRVVPWGWRSVFLIVATMILAMNVVAFGFAVSRERAAVQERGKIEAASLVEVDRKFSPPELMLMASFSSLIVLTLGPAILRRTSGATRADMGFASRHLARDVGIGFAAFFLVTPLVMLANLAAQQVFRVHKHELEKMLRGEPGQGSFVILAVISAVILAPISEEFVFRAVIQGWLRRVYLARFDMRTTPEGVESDPEFSSVPAPAKTWPSMVRLMPIVLTSAFFGLVHFEQMPAPIPIFVLSLALGALYEWTESLVPSIVLHALFNGFNTAALLIMIRENTG